MESTNIKIVILSSQEESLKLEQFCVKDRTCRKRTSNISVLVASFDDKSQD
jgi:hypothetical protein